MGVGTTIGMLSSKAIDTCLGISTKDFTGVTVGIILHKARLLNSSGFDISVAVRTSEVEHESSGASNPSSLKFGYRATEGFDKYREVIINQDTAIAIPSLRRRLEASMDIMFNPIVITINGSLEAEVVYTVRNGFLARLTSDVAIALALGVVENGPVSHELGPLLTPLDLPIIHLRDKLFIVIDDVG